MVMPCVLIACLSKVSFVEEGWLVNSPAGWLVVGLSVITFICLPVWSMWLVSP